ncbi:YbjN domain-containing protein [Mycobacterium sp. TJFP1]
MADDTTQGDVNRDARWDIETQLAANLPGLTDDNLGDLARRVTDELHTRVGEALSKGLTSLQMDEFDELTRLGDDRLCAHWLDANRPAYRATVATVRAELVAEVVRTVAEANPVVAQGKHLLARLMRNSIDVVEQHLGAHGLEYTRADDGVLRVSSAAKDNDPPTVVCIALSGRAADALTLTGSAVGADFPDEEHDRLAAYAANWNRRTWSPKALVISDLDTGRCKITGEVAAYTGRLVTRSQIDAVIGHGMRSMFMLFSDARRTLNPEFSPAGPVTTPVAGDR